jgi:uncharacterized membrane protein
MRRIGFLFLIIFLTLFIRNVVAFDEWWNVSWNYRVKLEINSTQYARDNWTAEIDMNFTELLSGASRLFDINSTRVIEYSQSGSVLQEVKSQFDAREDFNASSNAVGTLVLLMNGTTPANSKRIFYVYYDKGNEKPASNYSSSIVYGYSEKIINVNNTFLRLYIDTNKAENTSGLYRVLDKYNNVIFTVSGTNRTAEYTEYFNGTNNLTFNLINNFTITNGPVRLTIKQTGDETVFGNPVSKTNEARLTKKYYIYDLAGTQQKGTFIKIIQTVANNASYEINRNSTPAGALAFDLNRTLSSGYIASKDYNSSDPYSWAWGSGSGGEIVGVVNLNETGTSNFYANANNERIGISLGNTSMASGYSITQSSLVYFGTGGTDATTEFSNIKNRFATPMNVSQSSPESLYINITAFTDSYIYNRNETVLITGNVTVGDPYNITKYMNATIDMGTADAGDDQTIMLYDDGTHNDTTTGDKVFTNVFEIANNATIGTWAINFTAYKNSSSFINSTILNFNVTGTLDVNIVISNPTGLANRIIVANIYVKNYRQNAWIARAAVNCTYNSAEVVNKTDYINGTYTVNFTAPESEGTYSLYCNATKNGNFGNSSNTFTTETAKTSVIIISVPSNATITNITLYSNETFSILANASNTGSGTAYSANISLELLAGWSSGIALACGNINMTGYCVKSFNITVPGNTTPGTYTVNASIAWTNPDGTSEENRTAITVNVTSNPKLDVMETAVSGQAIDGRENSIGNFTVLSLGNDALQSITFNCYSGEVCNNFSVTFIPSSIASITAGQNQTVAINVTIPLLYSGGIYTGLINVSSGNTNDIFTLEVTIPSKTNITVSASPANYTARNITQLNNESFSFSANLTNVGNSSARYINITLALPSSWSANSTIEYCGNLSKSGSCARNFYITIPNATAPGNYSVNISASWTNLDNSTSARVMLFNVSVASNALITITQTNLSGTVSYGTTFNIGNFTILSIGNDALQSISFSCYSGEACNNLSVNFIPSSIASIAAGQNQTVAVNISVPNLYSPGTYNGTVNISSGNGGHRYLNISVTVPSNRTWTMSTTYCEKVESPSEGTACELVIRNTGNDIINFTISPQTGNHTNVNVTSFSILKNSNYTISILYNVTNVTLTTYQTNFTVDAVQADVNPDTMNLIVVLLPYRAPLINLTILPESAEQNSYVEFFVNVTDRSDSGIAWVNVNITRPNGTIDTINLTNTSIVSPSVNLSQWYSRYPVNNSLGNTTERGTYIATVYTQDNIGNPGNLSLNFSVYSKLLITVRTLSDSYLQGDTGSIYYIVRGINDSSIPGVNVTFYIMDSNNNMSYYTTRETNSDGAIYPMPSFTLSSDVPIGSYLLISNSSYYDSIAGKTVSVIANKTFQVKERTITVSGLFADIETVVSWYPDNVMKFGFLIYNGEGMPVDPTAMNLTIYDPADDVYLYASLTTADPIEKEATGFYSYDKAMSSNTPVGMFLAVLNVVQNEFQTTKLKAFRVSRGGPYDVRINLTGNEVRQGSYLNFILTIENKGEVSQDAYVEYWVSGQNNTYYSASEAVYTPSLLNQSFTRSAYIYSDQPLGNYTLNAKVTYDNVQPPIRANSSFVVLEKIPSVPPTVVPSPTPAPIHVPTGQVVPTPPSVTGILISRYSSNISLARDMTGIESVVVENTGNFNLNNVSILLVGIPTSWYNITPGIYSVLPKGNSSVFLINFHIPKDAAVGAYSANIIANSGTESDQKTTEITIYKSLKEVITADIQKLKDDLQELTIETKVAEREGKNVSSILILLDEIKNKISLAEDNLEKDNTDDALENVSDASNLIERVKALLSSLELRAVEFPLLPLLAVFIAIVTVIVSVYILNKRKKLPKLVLPHIRGSTKGINKEELLKEKDKLLRVLKILEKEKDEKIISTEAYEEVKKTTEKKLAEIEKKLKK